MPTVTAPDTAQTAEDTDATGNVLTNDAGATPIVTGIQKFSDTTATGPTASTRLVPSTAYKTSGATLAYRPTWGGNPANAA